MRKIQFEFRNIDVEIWADENGNNRELFVLDADDGEQLAVFRVAEEEE